MMNMTVMDDPAEYYRAKRREAFREPDPRNLSKGWTEEEWIKVSRHTDPLTGAIVYHSFADYCMD